jgi:hypothetical protein
MKIKKLIVERLSILGSVAMVVIGLLIISQMYFVHVEAKALYDGCQGKGGFPVIEKSGLSIDYFHCETD